MDRDILVKLGVIERMIDKNSLLEIYDKEPFVYKLLLDKFKEFLSDDYFEKIERQLILFRFLRNDYPLEISREIVEYASNCVLKDDYTKVILEWNLISSQYNKMYNLYQFDGCDLILSKQDKINKDHSKILDDEIINELTSILLDDINSKEGE